MNILLLFLLIFMGLVLGVFKISFFTEDVVLFVVFIIFIMIGFRVIAGLILEETSNRTKVLKEMYARYLETKNKCYNESKESYAEISGLNKAHLDILQFVTTGVLNLEGKIIKINQMRRKESLMISLEKIGKEMAAFLENIQKKKLEDYVKELKGLITTEIKEIEEELFSNLIEEIERKKV